MTSQEAWEALERELWPEGPAHGSGSGIYAKHKPRIQAAIEAESGAQRDRLRDALRDASEAAHVWTPSGHSGRFEDCPATVCQKARAALTDDPEADFLERTRATLQEAVDEAGVQADITVMSATTWDGKPFVGEDRPPETP